MQEKRVNGQGPPRIKVVQEDYFVKKPAATNAAANAKPAVPSAVKRLGSVLTKQIAPASKKQKNDKKAAEHVMLVEKRVETLKVVPVVRAAKTLSKTQKRELQKEAQFDSLVSKYKTMIDIQ